MDNIVTFDRKARWIGRREFSLKSLCTLALLFGTTIYAVGCDVATEILDWAPVGLAALNGILFILSGAGIGVPALIVTAIKAGFADVIADIQAWQANPPKGTVDAIDTVLALLLKNFQDLLAQLVIPDSGLLNTIMGLAGLILSTIAGFLMKLPSSSSLPKSFKLMGLDGFTKHNFKIMGQEVKFTAVHRKARAFKVAWNQMCKGWPESQIPLTLKEKLHLTAE